MNENDMKELARAETRAAANLLRRAGRVVDTNARERLAKAAQAAQSRALSLGAR